MIYFQGILTKTVDCYIFLLTSFPKTYFPRTIFPIDIFSQRHVFPVTFFPIYFFSYWLLFLQTCFPSVIFSQMTFFPIYFPKSRMEINLLFWNIFMFFCDQCLQKKMPPLMKNSVTKNTPLPLFGTIQLSTT